MLGGGGHCKSVLDVAEAMRCFHILGILAPEGEGLFGVPRLGGDEFLPELYARGVRQAFVSLGSVGKPDRRQRLYESAKAIGFAFPNIIDPGAAISGYAEMGEGIFVGKNAVVNAGSVVGNLAIINTGAIVEHDCQIGALAHISPGAVLCGNVSVGAKTHIGAGTVILQGIKVGEASLVGCASAVLRDIPEHVKAYGNPCRTVGAI